MRFTLGTTNLAGVVGNFLAADRRAQTEIKAVVKSAGFRTQTLAKQYAPVRTTHLRKNIRLTFTDNKLGYSVGCNTEDFVGKRNPHGQLITYPYFFVMEMGSRTVAARPFLFPAAEVARRTFAPDLSAALRRALARQAR